jgi:hypothetical protein
VLKLVKLVQLNATNKIQKHAKYAPLIAVKQPKCATKCNKIHLQITNPLLQSAVEGFVLDENKFEDY